MRIQTLKTLLAFPVLCIAAAGFLLSLAVHLAATWGFEIPERAMLLHVGIFVVWIDLDRLT